MITSAGLDQHVVAALMVYDPVVSEYRAFFGLLDWSQVPERDENRPWPGSPPYPQGAYVKALLVKVCEGFEYITDLRKFLVKHPLYLFTGSCTPGGMKISHGYGPKGWAGP